MKASAVSGALGRTLGSLVLLGACHPEPAAEAPAHGEVIASSAAEPPSSVPHADDPSTRARLPSGPAIVVNNHEATGIEIHGAYVVDERGELGTRMLWPHRLDCPEVQAPPHLVAGGGTLLLAPPTEAYVAGSCAPVPLPPGDYVLRLDSGYGEGLYAAAVITLPLAGPVELQMQNHDTLPACDGVRARRAAVLAFAAAEADGQLPSEFRTECDVQLAGCGTLPIEDTPPPPTCTITLHERLLRVERAASSDAPRWLTAWVDHEVVYAQRPDVTRTSASRVDVDGKPVTIAGTSSRHRHQHGGDAASIGSVRFIVHNPHSRALRLRVRGVEYLTDSQCGLPNEVRTRPTLAKGSPTELAPGASELVVAFEPQAAYQAHCDRFATRVTFEVEGRRITATAEHEVMRFDPIRR